MPLIIYFVLFALDILGQQTVFWFSTKALWGFSISTVFYSADSESHIFHVIGFYSCWIMTFRHLCQSLASTEAHSSVVSCQDSGQCSSHGSAWTFSRSFDTLLFVSRSWLALNATPCVLFMYGHKRACVVVVAVPLITFTQMKSWTWQRSVRPKWNMSNAERAVHTAVSL